MEWQWTGAPARPRRSGCPPPHPRSLRWRRRRPHLHPRHLSPPPRRAKYLATTQLKEAAEGFLECMADDFKEEELKVSYEELFTHHEDCTRDEKGKVVECCEDCRSVFRKCPVDEDE